MATNPFEAYGIDYDDALDRFGGNIELFKRLASKYANDSHFVGMVAALEAGDYEQAYRDAHALKGVSGNLSFSQLYNLTSQICFALREGNPETAISLLPDTAEAHRKALDAAIAIRAGKL